MKNPALGQIVGAQTWGRCIYQEGTPDMFYYGIHGIEMLFTLMGTGCESVARIQTDDADALAIANDTLYGLGAGVWTRDGTRAYKMGRGIKAGRVWTNCYHQYPAGASFGGYKISGIGRENHLMMLDHYSQTKNLLVSYSTKPLGLF